MSLFTQIIAGTITIIVIAVFVFKVWEILYPRYLKVKSEAQNGNKRDNAERTSELKGEAGEETIRTEGTEKRD